MWAKRWPTCFVPRSRSRCSATSSGGASTTSDTGAGAVSATKRSTHSRRDAACSTTAVKPYDQKVRASRAQLVQRSLSCRSDSSCGAPPGGTRPDTVRWCCTRSPSMQADRGSRSATERATVVLPAPGTPMTSRIDGSGAVIAGRAPRAAARPPRAPAPTCRTRTGRAAAARRRAPDRRRRRPGHADDAGELGQAAAELGAVEEAERRVHPRRRSSPPAAPTTAKPAAVRPVSS